MHIYIYIYKCTPDPMVKGKSFEKCKKEQMDVQCASAVGSFISVWIKSFPDIYIREVLAKVQSRHRSLEWN